jgi:hypothetical protein
MVKDALLQSKKVVFGLQNIPFYKPKTTFLIYKNY